MEMRRGARRSRETDPVKNVKQSPHNAQIQVTRRKVSILIPELIAGMRTTTRNVQKLRCTMQN